jgi:hypothetical protein
VWIAAGGTKGRDFSIDCQPAHVPALPETS